MKNEMINNRLLISGLISAILAALIFCLAAGSALAEADRPESGTLIRESDMAGRCQLDIINNASDDLVAYLCTMREETVRTAVFIRGGDAFNLTGGEDGSYYLYFQQGESWNASRESFEVNARSSRMREPLLFQTISTADRIQYS
ncbi:MAG: hypothetical protein GX463_10275, partial [Methanothrix sp.]|nr:hypothetical protein [Methanothrix sp.]